MPFHIKDYLPDFKRLPADWLLAAALSIISSAIGTWWAATAENTPKITSVGWLVIFVVFAFALLALFACGAWVAGWTRRQWRHEAQPATTSDHGVRKQEYVQFRFPTTRPAGLGFKLASIEDKTSGKMSEAEEVHVFVHVIQRMQNVQFEMRAMRWRSDSWETVAKIGSSILAGTVHKDRRQSIVVMRRTFRRVPTQYDHPFWGTKQSTAVRAEKDVIIFPEDPVAFPASLGEAYLFHITIYHDDGPERASFALRLHPTLDLPQTGLESCENIEPMITRK